MSDLSGKTITLPASLRLPGGANWWSPQVLRDHADDMEARGGHYAPSALLRSLADEIERQRPPRMDEPDEFGAMVEAGTHVEGDSPRERRPLVRHQKSGTLQWSDEHGRTYAWSELVDPRPVGGAS